MSRHLFHRLAQSASCIFGGRQPSPRRLRSRPPQIEALETRQLLACNPGIASGVLRANCNDNASNAIVLSANVSPWTRITFPGGTRDFLNVDFSTILLNMGTAADSVSIFSVPAGKPVTVNGGGGSDTVAMGQAQGGLRGILSNVFVENPPAGGYTSLRLFDRGNSTARNVLMEVNAGTGIVTGLAPANIQYRVNDVSDLFVQTGDGNDTVNIFNTQRNGPYEVRVTLDNAGGNDVVNVGNALTGLQDIQAPVVVGPSTGRFQLNLNDAANTTGRTVTTSWNAASGYVHVTGLAPVPIYYHPVSFNSFNSRVRITNGSGNDQYQINAIGGNSYSNHLQLDLGAGNDRVTVSLEKPNSWDALDVFGQAGADSLVFNYQSMPLGRLYQLFASGIVHPSVNAGFETLEDVTLHAGPGVDTIAVVETAAGVSTTVNGGAGNDSLLGGNSFSGLHHRGPLTMRGQDGADILYVNDEYTTSGQVYTVTSTQVTATTNGVAPINYETAEGVVLTAGTGADTIRVQSTAAGAPVTVHASNGDDTIWVGGTDFVWAQASAVTVNGQGGVDTLHLIDQGSADAPTYTLTATAVHRTGNDFPVNYATTEHLALHAGYGDDLILVESTAAAVLTTTVNTGPGNDTIRLTSGALASEYLILNGEEGNNTLDYSLYTSDVYVDLGLYGGTDVLSLLGVQNVLGGAGNDTLIGDDQDNVLSGGPGSDALYGNGGRDVLLGGLDFDLLVGGDGEDLLLGGVTLYDGDLASLQAIALEWARTDLDYAGRVERLTTGADGLPALTAETVSDDYAGNELAGNSGLDWFFAGAADVLEDLEEGERVDSVF